VLAAEHFLDFAGFDDAGELLDPGGQFGADIFTLRRPVDQDAEIV
jgi:hypothetical protein